MTETTKKQKTPEPEKKDEERTIGELEKIAREEEEKRRREEEEKEKGETETDPPTETEEYWKRKSKR